MKLLPLLAFASTSAITFDNALAAVESRYVDMGLKRIDSGKFLQKRTRKMVRKMLKKKKGLQKRGCFKNKVTHDFSLDIVKKCKIEETLIDDGEGLLKFFEGPGDKCDKFRQKFRANYIGKITEFFEDKEATCEVNLPSSFGAHSSVIGRVQVDAIVFDGIKYG